MHQQKVIIHYTTELPFLFHGLELISRLFRLLASFIGVFVHFRKLSFNIRKPDEI
jgi:hypothetical protein